VTLALYICSVYFYSNRSVGHPLVSIAEFLCCDDLLNRFAAILTSYLATAAATTAVVLYQMIHSKSSAKVSQALLCHLMQSSDYDPVKYRFGLCCSTCQHIVRTKQRMHQHHDTSCPDSKWWCGCCAEEKTYGGLMHHLNRKRVLSEAQTEKSTYK